MDGELRDGAVSVPITTHALHYGTAVFDGGRFYLQPDGQLAVFRAGDHIARFMRGCRAAFLEMPYSATDLHAATMAVVAAHGGPGYVRQLAFPGDGQMGVSARNPVHTCVLAWTPAAKPERRVVLASAPLRGSLLPGTKLAGQYARVYHAAQQARALGYDDTLFLDERGCLAEASAAAVLLVIDGKLVTPPLYEPILPSITRDSVLQLARADGLVVEERPVRYDEAFGASEMLLASSAGEVRIVGALDGRSFPATDAPIATALQQAYRQAVHGARPAFAHWLTAVAAPTTPAPARAP